MKRVQPRQFRRRRVQQALNQARKIQNTAARVQSISHQFLGEHYGVNLLTGSAAISEVFTATLESFDCVTYIETVIALTYARSVEDFASLLQQIRYADGRVEWRSRNHYMTDWIRNNARAGLVRRVQLDATPQVKERVLNVVSGLPPRRLRFSCIPKRSLLKVTGKLQSGDLIFFASTRRHLDIFHCGIVIRDGARILLRHASRSQGGVVEQDLSSFLSRNRMAGVVVVRPVERTSP
jgi:cell wall-associated NlpC family hydrolase